MKDVIGNRYEVERILGEGASGRVYLVRDSLRDNELLALKVLEEDTRRHVELLRSEFAILCALHHPNIARALDLGRDDNLGAWFYTCEFVQGTMITEACRGRDIPEVCGLFAQLFRALQHIHAHGILHYDIKPANILVDPAGNLKIIDFGLATREAPVPGLMRGTIGYCAPEVVRGQPGDARSDLYSAGVVMYEALCGRALFTGDSALDLLRLQAESSPAPLRDLAEHIPGQLEQIVLRLLEREPAQRYRSANEVIRALSRQADVPLEEETSETAVAYISSGALVGREEHVARFEHVLDSLMHDAPVSPICVLTGEVGIGKTRLLREFAYLAQLRGANVLRFDCSAGYGPQTHAVLHSLRSVLLDGNAARDSDGVVLPPEHACLQEDEVSADRTARALAEASKLRPVVLALDDVDSRGSEVLKFLESLARVILLKGQAGEVCRTLVLLTCDSDRFDKGEMADAFKRLSEVGLADRIHLPALSESQVAGSVEGMFGKDALPPEAMSAIASASGGNPLLLEHAVQEFLKSGALFFEAGSWHMDATLARLKTPPRVLDSLRMRIEGLPENERSIAQVLVCAGRAADFELLRTVLGMSCAECATAIGQLTAKRLLVCTESGEYVFSGGRIADAAADALEPDRCVALHRRIFECLRERERPPVELALHASMAGLHDEILVPLLLDAIGNTQYPVTPAHAIELREALIAHVAEDCRERYSALEELIELCWRTARTDETLKYLRMAQTEVLWQYPDIAARIMSRFVSTHIRSGRPQDAEQFVETAIARLTSRYKAMATVEMADILEAKGDMGQARAHLVQARDALSGKKSPETVNAIDYRLALLDYRQRNLDEAERRCRMLLKRRSAARYRPALHNLLGLIRREKGFPDEALRQFELSLKAYDEEGNYGAQGYVRANTAMVLYDRGDYDEALSAYLTAKPLFKILGDDMTYASELVSVGKAHFALGHVSDAFSSYDEALRIEQTVQSPVVRTAARFCRAQACACMGRTQAALDDLEEVITEVRKSGAKNIEALALCERARVLAYLCGDLVSAERELAGAKALDVCDFPAAQVQMSILGAELAALKDKPGEALALIEEGKKLAPPDSSRHEIRIVELGILIQVGRLEEAHNLSNRLEHEKLSVASDVRFSACRVCLAAAFGRQELDKGINLERLTKKAGQFGAPLLLFEMAVCSAELALVNEDGSLAEAYLQQAAEACETIASALPKKYDRKNLLASPVFKRTDIVRQRLQALKPSHNGTYPVESIAGRSVLRAAGMDERLLIRDGLALLGMVTRLSSLDLDIEEILSLSLSMVLDITRAERGFIVLVDEGGSLRNLTARDISEVELTSAQYDTSHTMVQEVIRTGKSRLVSDTSLDDLLRTAKSVIDLGLNSVLCVPIAHKDQVLGVVYLDSTSIVQAFGDADLFLMEEFSRRIAPLISHAVEQARLKAKLVSLEEEMRMRYSYASIVGRSKPMRELFAVLDSVTDTDVTVYIYGETGTGKDLVAKALHYNSRRSIGSFVSVNCAALPESLLESELFGHVRGAFTGAESDRTGLIETASEGTLFLDEIGIMPLDMQAKLLRVIEEQRVRRIGSADAAEVDVRIVCASNTRIEDLVDEGAFREDLFYRLNVVRIELPPLRDRREDIPLLAEHFLKEFAQQSGEDVREIDSEALAKLYAYTYPGNIRQLRNILQQAYLTSRGRITVKEIDAALRAQKHEAQPESAVARKLSIEEYMREFVLAHQHDHTETELARLLGITRQHLYKKRKDWKILRPK